MYILKWKIHEILQGWNVIEKQTSIAYMIIYVSMSFNIFIFCYIGEVLTEQVKSYISQNNLTQYILGVSRSIQYVVDLKFVFFFL